MSRITGFFTRRRALGALGVLGLGVAALGLQGFRGPWHHGYDPARFDKRMDHIQEEIAEDLHLTAQQKPQFEALMARARELAKERRERWHQTAADVKAALEKDPADPDTVATTIKNQMHQRVDQAKLDQLIDDTAAFYRTLDPQQQEQVRKHMLRRLQWRLG
ncbi:MAG TPA: Spy/CpxP family protein refolding chaperone [bacterium]|nr:Spy/CpxP family protein refolding chaperone [bacterium]